MFKTILAILVIGGLAAIIIKNVIDIIKGIKEKKNKKEEKPNGNND